jgi:replicative DNA helicase
MGALIRNHIIRNDEKPGLFFSAEMPKSQILDRVMSGLAKVKYQRIRSGVLSKEEWVRLIYARSLVENGNFFIDDTSGISIDYIQDVAHDFKEKSVVGIDYLQLISAKAEDKRLEVSKVAEKCKEIAKKERIPVVALAQISREAEKDANKRPNSIKVLMESDKIGQSADTVIALYRDKYYNQNTPWGAVAEFIILKQRNGPVGTVYSLFLDEYTIYEDLSI